MPLQVAGDLHTGGRASGESARSPFDGTSAADAAPDDIRDSQSDGTLAESELEVLSKQGSELAAVVMGPRCVSHDLPQGLARNRR